MFYKFLFFSALSIITVLAVVPNYNALPTFVSVSDVINHIAAFTALMLLLQLAYPSFKTYLHVILLLIYGILIEVVQHFLPSRYGDIYDVISDMVGITLAIIVTYSYATIFKTIRSK